MTDRTDVPERPEPLRAEGAAGEPVARPPSRAFGLSVGVAALAATGALAYALWPASGDDPVAQNVAAPAVVVSAEPMGLAALSPDARLKLANTAAFPEGRSAELEGGSRVEYETGELVEAPFGPVLVSEGRVPDAAHVDSGHVAIHYLAPEGQGYRVVKAFPDAIRSGSFGQMSEMAVSRKFSDLPVVYSEGGGTWQGYSCGWTTLTELRPEGPAELVTFMDSYDDSGAKEQGAQATEGKITDIVPGESFVVRFTGSRNFTAHYVRKGDKYELQGGDANALEGC